MILTPMAKQTDFTKNTGFSLVEILVALTILTLVAGSIFSAFSTSRQMLFSAGELSQATSLAGSYLAAVSEVKRLDIKPVSLTEETSLPLAFRPETLKLSPAPAPYKRSVSVFAVNQEANDGGPFYKVSVEITWTKKSAKAEPRYISSTIIRGRQ